MKAVEKGRRLEVTFGEDDDQIVFLVDPVNIQVGEEMLAKYVQIFSAVDGTDTDVKEVAEDLATLSIGEANVEQAQQLRPDEYKFLTLSAFFWNTSGGGAEALEAFKEGGIPKALGVVFGAVGMPLTPPSTT